MNALCDTKSPKQFRVIDINNNCLINAPKGCDYIALSYLWGGVDQQRLTRSVKARWMEHGALENVKLARTISDAIWLTSKLEYSYLWVDSLCIIQDDESDQIYQIEQMHRIYAYAVVTIIAATGTNSESGIARLHNPRKTGSGCLEVDGKMFACINTDTQRLFDLTLWNSRGWTLQERIFSQRSLIFTDTLVGFSCKTASWSEDVCLEARPGRSKYSEFQMTTEFENHAARFHYLTHKLPKKSLVPKSRFDWCTDVIKSYIQRSLTNQSDILKAFQGISESMRSNLGVFHYGMPEQFLAGFVTWSSSCTTVSRREGFPSWSWVGWQLQSSSFYVDSNWRFLLTVYSFRGERPCVSKLDAWAIEIDYTYPNNIKIDPEPPRRIAIAVKALKSRGVPILQLVMFSTVVLTWSSFVICERCFEPGLITYRLSLDLDGRNSVENRQPTLSHWNNLTEITLSETLDPDTEPSLEFIAVGVCNGIFVLMLIAWEKDVAYRVVPTLSSISISNWQYMKPKRKLIILR
jgi:hypothetical protein